MSRGRGPRGGPPLPEGVDVDYPLPEIPSTVVARPDGKGVGLVGGLSIASTASEVFLLEYAEGKAPWAWGRLTLDEMRQTLAGAASPQVERDAKVVAYVGHDTNLANLGGMLEAPWSMPGYQANETPPAGALVFERRITRDGSRRVYVPFVVQSPDQMRAASPLSLAAPPIVVPVRVPGCSANAPGYPSDATAFARVARGAIDQDCVPSPR